MTRSNMDVFAHDFLTNFSWVGPGYGLVRGQRGEQCVCKLRHQNIHVKQRVHLHWGRCVIVFTRQTAWSGVFILIKGDTEHVWSNFPKQWQLLLRPLWVVKMQPPSQLMAHEHAVLRTANMASHTRKHSADVKRSFSYLYTYSSASYKSK